MDVKEKQAFDEYFKEKYPELYKDVFNEDGDERAIIGYSFALSAWQARAKAQAVPEVKISHTVTLTCAQLLEAFRFGAPDEDDPEQLKTEMTITWSDVGHSGKGYYCYYSELPEEGAIFLDEEGEAQEST
jgi:hypothetical protein